MPELLPLRERRRATGVADDRDFSDLVFCNMRTRAGGVRPMAGVECEE
jgi:hypothetical protein